MSSNDKGSFDVTYEDHKDKYGLPWKDANSAINPQDEDPNVSDDKPVDPNATEPTSDKGYGGKRVGAGRPRGSRNQFSKHSVERLKELGFDPLEKMVALYHETTKIIEEMEDPKHSRRYSAQAVATLIINKQKIVNDLMRYGYRYVPEKVEQEITEKQAPRIKLLGADGEDLSQPKESDKKDN